MRTSSRSVALVLFDEVEILDAAGPLEVLTLAGRQWNYRPFKIFTTAARPGLVETRNQIRLEARYAFADCPAPELIVVPGGYGARKALNSPELVEWLRTASATATCVLGVGNGVLLLAKAGLLDDADVAIGSELAEFLKELAPSARADSAPFRESGRVVTAATAFAGLDAALHVVGKLLGKKQAAQLATLLGSARDPAALDIIEL